MSCKCCNSVIKVLDSGASVRNVRFSFAFALVAIFLFRYRDSTNSAFDTFALQEKLSSLRGSVGAFAVFINFFFDLCC